MNIIAIGLNHKTTSIESREKFALSREEVEMLLSSLHSHPDIEEAVILSTCNRTEVYAYSLSDDSIKQWLSSRSDSHICFNDFMQHAYIMHDVAAVEHLMRVACGLDSLILGEPEILGQVKSAFSLACLHKTVGLHLSRLFRQTFHVAKQIRSSTKIGACPVSVASTAVMYASQWWQQANAPRILVIGVGSVGRIAAKHAQSLTSHPIYIMSRHLHNAQRVAQDVRGIAVDFSQLSDCLCHIDLVISATASKTAVISENHVRHVTKPTLMIDLAVPRDIAPEVVSNAYITLCQLDQLKNIIQDHVNMRAHAATQAEKLIEEAARECILSMRSINSDEIIKQYRATMQSYCNGVLESFSKDNLTQEDLRQFSQNLLNKIMHLPSSQLRRASIEGRDDLLESATEIFGIQGSEK